ncbi:hypothetical protein [Streptomyces hebeiensis]
MPGLPGCVVPAFSLPAVPVVSRAGALALGAARYGLRRTVTGR